MGESPYLLIFKSCCGNLLSNGLGRNVYVYLCVYVWSKCGKILVVEFTGWAYGVYYTIFSTFFCIWYFHNKKV